MNIWTRLLIAIGIGAIIGVGCALLGNMLGIGGSILGGLSGALTAGFVAATLRPKSDTQR